MLENIIAQIVAGLILLLVGGSLPTFYYKKNKRIKKYVSADDIKHVNNELLKEAKSEISSTRTLPFAGGNDEAQEEYGKKIAGGMSVSRIWLLQNVEDFRKMEKFLTMYSKERKYRLSYYHHKDIVVPEISIFDNKIASVTLPEPGNPNTPHVCVHFTRKDDIDIWQKYFNSLWEKASALCENGRVDTNKLEAIGKEIVGDDYVLPSIYTETTTTATK